ncbi:MAG: 16S rRNA (adenine(1518)-N(6)/adenine(1519)-N(6))-dimethyltransferase RsmA [Anaerolineae bacterium]|nr:16S rRNA (adenine(1518)-N(6)/adenine(1519)-N(6))-dimethyltransferase RsmA [Anaerolineae bacterium]
MNPKKLLDYFDVAPKQSLGQNFLADPGALAHIVDIAEVGPDDVVLEIGAGTGALTRHLAGAAKRVIAVEVDSRLIPILQEQIASFPNVVLVEADILEVNAGELMQTLAGTETFQVVANLPYYITAAILRRLLENPPRPTRLTLTVQREVAERLAAQPGDMSLLAVSVQFYGRVRVAHRIKAGAFWPTPGVDSAVVRIDTYTDGPPVPVDDERQFFRVVRAGFGQKRKQIKNALAGGLGLEARAVVEALERAGVAPSRRAETLSLAEWTALTAALREHL